MVLIIADDHPLFRAALREAVTSQISVSRVVETASLDGLQDAISENPDIDLILLDLQMPGANGFSSLLYLRAEHPTVPVIVVSAAEDPKSIQRALDFGASGFIPKSARIETIGESVRTVLAGGMVSPRSKEPLGRSDFKEQELARKVASLTPQQLKVLFMLPDGESNKAIANSLAVTEATIKAHITAILRKLGLERRTQAAIVAQRLFEPSSRFESAERIEG